MRFFVITLFLLFSTIFLTGQDCTDYHQYHCVFGDYTYFYSRQSASYLSKRGQTTEIQMVVYGGEEYYIAVCAHRKFGNLQFRILEDNDEKSEIYNNADNSFNSSIEFSNKVTRNLIIEITVPEASGEENERRCVGLVIQFRKKGGNPN